MRPMQIHHFLVEHKDRCKKCSKIKKLNLFYDNISKKVYEDCNACRNKTVRQHEHSEILKIVLECMRTANNEGKEI